MKRLKFSDSQIIDAVKPDTVMPYVERVRGNVYIKM